MKLKNVFDRIHQQFGFVTADDVKEIRQIMPNPTMRVLVRCGGDRFLCGLDELDFRMAEVERKGDYVRDVSIPAQVPTEWASLGYSHSF